jgi:hypothetical protein
VRVPRLVLLEMTIADKIMNVLRQHAGLTAIDIAVNVFGRRHPYKQRVNHACRRLVDEGRLERRGKGAILSLIICRAPKEATLTPRKRIGDAS